MITTSWRSRRTNRQAARITAGASLVLAALVWSACEPGPPVEFSNQTGGAVKVFQGGEFVFELQPGQTRKIAGREKGWIPEIRVISEEGKVLLDESITWDELDSADWKITIEEPG